MPRRNLENSSKTPPFCFTTEFEENGSSGCCDVYPGRSNISRPLIFFRMVQYTLEKCTEMPSRSAIGCCSNILDLKKRYTVQFTGDDRSMVQWRHKRWLILLNRNERTESVRTIEELSLEFVPQAFKPYFPNFLLKANQQFVEMLPTTYIFQSCSIYNLAGKVVWSIKNLYDQI